MVFKPGQTSRKAFIGIDYDDAKQRQTKNDINPLTGRFGNDITSDEVRDLKITHPNKFLELTRTPKAGEESFFAVGLCEGCTRNHPGHLSFTNHATTPYFARRPSLCGVGVCTQSSQNQALDRDENEPRRRVAIFRERFQLIDDNNGLRIEWHRGVVDLWPSYLTQGDRDNANSQLRDDIDELDSSNLSSLEFISPITTATRLDVNLTNNQDFHIQLYKFSDKMRYFFGGFKKINNMSSRGKLEEVKPNGFSNEKEIIIKDGESALIWIPSLPSHTDNPNDNWKDRIDNSVADWIAEFKDTWQNVKKYCQVNTLIHSDYPGVFLAIYSTSDIGVKRALLSSTEYNIKKLRQLVDASHSRQPFIDFREETTQLRFFWNKIHNSPFGVGRDVGSDVLLETKDGQLDLMVMSNGLTEVENTDGCRIGVKGPDGDTKPLESMGKKDCFGNVWISLRFAKQGEHVICVVQGKDKRFVRVNVVNPAQVSTLSVHLESKGWMNWTESGWLDAPDLGTKEGIINSNADQILGNLVFDTRPYQDLQPDECFVGLVQDIARFVFEHYKSPQDSIHAPTFTRRIREICYLIHMRIWPGENIDFSIPSLGLLMRRMVEFEYCPRVDEKSDWKWGARQISAQRIPGLDEWFILYDYRTDEFVKNEYGLDSISVNLETGIRFIRRSAVNDSGINVVNNRPDLDRIAFSPVEWLGRIWAAANIHSQPLPNNTQDTVNFRWSGVDQNIPKVMSREDIKTAINSFDWYQDLKIMNNFWVRKNKFSDALGVKVPSGKLFLHLSVDKNNRDKRGDRIWRLYLGHFSIDSGIPVEKGILIATQDSLSDRDRIGWIDGLGNVGTGANHLNLGFTKYPWSSDYLDKAYLTRETCRAFVTVCGVNRGTSQHRLGVPGFINIYPNQHQDFKYDYPRILGQSLESNFGLRQDDADEIIEEFNEELLRRLWWQHEN